MWALVPLTLFGLGGGWLLAGHMLKPLNRVTAAAGLVRDGSLSHRIRMPGRSNELTDLADTFDDMLDRVQRSVDEHRRFAANASHELRTPLTVIRTMLEVARTAPESQDVDRLLQRMAEMNERSISLTGALLDLAGADHHARRLIPVDLDDIAAAALREITGDADRRHLQVTTRLDAGTVLADPALLHQLMSNLLRNAVVHNLDGGDIRITTSRTPDGGRAVEVANSGRVIDPTALDTFTEPFTRGGGRAGRAGAPHAGSGLGLAIVKSIARVHGAGLTLEAPGGGGITVRVLFPPIIL